jgi:Na+-translocating ferredoxin:NAD+ oxidoreductase RnfG subunit
MYRFLIIILLLISSVDLIANPPEVSKKFEKELSKHYDSEIINKKEIKDLSNDKDLFFSVFKADANVGLVVLTTAKGRFDKFDFMIIYNTNYEIELIKILIYRSDYGAEITAKRWLSQFYSKQKDSLKYGSDIQAISGATLSASSLTENVNRINKILREYFNN